MAYGISCCGLVHFPVFASCVIVLSHCFSSCFILQSFLCVSCPDKHFLSLLFSLSSKCPPRPHKFYLVLINFPLLVHWRQCVPICSQVLLFSPLCLWHCLPSWAETLGFDPRLPKCLKVSHSSNKYWTAPALLQPLQLGPSPVFLAQAITQSIQHESDQSSRYKLESTSRVTGNEFGVANQMTGSSRNSLDMEKGKRFVFVL